MQTQNIIKTAVDQILTDVAKYLVKQKGLFVDKKMTTVTLLKLMKAFDVEDDASDDGEGDVAVPEGWTAENWAGFEKKREALGDSEVLNVSTARVLKSKAPKGHTVNKTWKLCVKEGEEEKLDAIVDFLQTNCGEAADEKSDASDEESEKPKAKKTTKKEESDDEDEEDEDEKPTKKTTKKTSKTAANLIEDYDNTKLKTLKKAIAKNDDEEKYVSVDTRRAIKKTKDNEKKYEFVEEPKLAITKVNAKDMAKHVKKVLAMLEEE